MFVSAESTGSVLVYRIREGEVLDRFSLKMLQAGEVPNLLVPGLEEPSVLRFPVAGLRSLEEYVNETHSAEAVKGILEEFLAIPRKMKEYMLPRAELLASFRCAFVDPGERSLRLVCLPTNESSFYAESLSQFCRSVISAALTEKTSAEDVDSLCYLLREVNKGELTEETLSGLLVSEPEPLREPVIQPVADVLPHWEREPEADVEEEKTARVPLREKIRSMVERSKAKDDRLDDPGDWVLFDALPEPGPAFQRENGRRDRQRRSHEEDKKRERDCVLSVRQSGRTFVLGEEPAVIGSDPALAEVCLENNPAAAREHCRVFREHGRYYVEDLNTETGTFLNGSRVRMWEPERLDSADVIRIGTEEIIYSERLPGGNDFA